jgi:tetraacyldisaccharide-1-P 4'-kinase
LISRCNKNNIKFIITTEKDSIKLQNYGELFAKYEIECYVVNIEIKIKNNKEKFFDYILNVIRK